MLRPGWTTTQGLSKKEVAEARCPQAHFNLLAIEVRDKLRIGERADVDYKVDLLRTQKTSECMEIMIGMPNCPDRRRLVHASTLAAPADDLRRRMSIG